ncbi:MAG: DUF4184 family protein [Cyclobacteriaceae bacterium]|nr:DUF4184 family protein [Cyclobacteriaceae bacterium]
MPFTPAHPAIILPLLKLDSRYVSATALIVGAVAPDFEYFLKMDVDSVYSHTVAGLFYFNLPVTIVLSFLFHEVVKHSLIRNLPPFLQRRFYPFAVFDFRKYFRSHVLTFALCSVIGSASHIFWDAFTHRDGYFIKTLPALYHQSYVPFQGVNYPLWYALQHISTFVGLSTIAIVVIALQAYPVEVVKPSGKYWWMWLVVVVVVVLLRFDFNLHAVSIGRFVVSSITACCVAFLVVGVMFFPKGSRPLP